MLPSFEKVPSPDKIVTRVQDVLKRILDRVTRNPILDSNWIANVSLSSGDNLISHGLGRNYVGFMCTLPSVAGTTLSESASPDRSLYLKVHASGNCTVSIYAF